MIKESVMQSSILQSRVSFIEDENTEKLKAEISKYEEQITNLTKRLDVLTKEHVQLESISKENVILKAHIAQLESVENAQILERKSNQITVLTNEISQLKEQYNEASHKLMDEKRQLNSKLAEQEIEAGNITMFIEEQENQIKGFKASQVKLQDIISQLEVQLKAETAQSDYSRKQAEDTNKLYLAEVEKVKEKTANIIQLKEQLINQEQETSNYADYGAIKQKYTQEINDLCIQIKALKTKNEQLETNQIEKAKQAEERESLEAQRIREELQQQVAIYQDEIHKLNNSENREEIVNRCIDLELNNKLLQTQIKSKEAIISNYQLKFISPSPINSSMLSSCKGHDQDSIQLNTLRQENNILLDKINLLLINQKEQNQVHSNKNETIYNTLATQIDALSAENKKLKAQIYHAKSLSKHHIAYIATPLARRHIHNCGTTEYQGNRICQYERIVNILKETVELGNNQLCDRLMSINNQSTDNIIQALADTSQAIASIQSKKVNAKCTIQKLPIVEIRLNKAAISHYQSKVCTPPIAKSKSETDNRNNILEYVAALSHDALALLDATKEISTIAKRLKNK